MAARPTSPEALRLCMISDRAANMRCNGRRASLVLGISDLWSIKEQVTMRIGDRTVQFEPGMSNTDIASNGSSAPFQLDSTQLGLAMDFDAQLTINGSGSYNLVPVRKVTRATCKSSCCYPSYQGALPAPTPTG